MTTRAELEAMQQGANSLETLGGQMNSTLGQLRSSVEATQGAWQGSAGGTFMTVMARWDESSSKINAALTDISQMLASNTASYGSTEQNSADTINAVGGSSTLNV